MRQRRVAVKVCLVHNSYGRFSGEEAVVNAQADLLKSEGHTVVRFDRSSAEIPHLRLGRFRAFLSGMYNVSARQRIRLMLAQDRPDLVHVHNLYPLISPSILPDCTRAGAPVVMTVHNYRLMCPNGLFLTHGAVCEKCRHGREYNCLLFNCEGNLFKSLGYSIRAYTARTLNLYRHNVSIFACLTEFQKHILLEEGFEANRITVLPNMVDSKGCAPGQNVGHYIAYVGRISPEKGVEVLLRAMSRAGGIPLKIAGAYDRMPQPAKQNGVNIEFTGYLGPYRLAEFYANSRIIVLPSICYETFGLPIVEAGLRCKPVIVSRIGGLPEIVDDGISGLLFEPGNADDLARKIRYLWDRPDLCREMGQAGREKALREYSPEKYYDRLMAVYAKAIKLGPPRAGRMDSL